MAKRSRDQESAESPESNGCDDDRKAIDSSQNDPKVRACSVFSGRIAVQGTAVAQYDTGRFVTDRRTTDDVVREEAIESAGRKLLIRCLLLLL